MKSSAPRMGPSQQKQWVPPDGSAWKIFNSARFPPPSTSEIRHMFPRTVCYTTLQIVAMEFY